MVILYLNLNHTSRRKNGRYCNQIRSEIGTINAHARWVPVLGEPYNWSQNHGKCKEVFHGAVKEHQVKVLCKIVALCEPVRGEQDDFFLCNSHNKKTFRIFLCFQIFFTDRAVKNIFFVMFLTYMCNTNYVRTFNPVRAVPQFFFLKLAQRKYISCTCMVLTITCSKNHVRAFYRIPAVKSVLVFSVRAIWTQLLFF